MKKIFYIPLLLLTMVIGVNKVSALTWYTSSISTFYREYDYWVDFNENNSQVVSTLVDYWQTHWSSTYSYYIIGDYNRTSNQTIPNYIYIIPTNSNKVVSSYSKSSFDYLFITENNQNLTMSKAYVYYPSTNTYELFDGSDYEHSVSTVTWSLYYSSNTTLYYEQQRYMAYETNKMVLPSYSNLDLDVSYPLTNISPGDEVPTYMSLTNGTPQADFTQVDMSQYEYIILSLKNYDTTTFNTTIYSLGRLCFTPVYNYGMTPKQDYLDGYQTQGCTEYYNTSTPVSIYIIQADLDNHAVYYIKRYENETNVLQIPTSIFDITYITSQNANNPQVLIGGRSYPSIPYSDLTDTANISTNEGYISGQVCALGDINCQTYESGMDISDLFTQPLKVLQSVWTSITSVFILIGEFIALIPSPLKEFLISAFMLSIILGILKIIL